MLNKFRSSFKLLSPYNTSGNSKSLRVKLSEHYYIISFTHNSRVQTLKKFKISSVQKLSYYCIKTAAIWKFCKYLQFMMYLPETVCINCLLKESDQ